MKIFTVCLNPAIDIFYRIPGFRPYRENTVASAAVYTGGKGVNVSRALLKNGCESTAFLLLGKENAPDYEKALHADGLFPHVFYTSGRIRENLTIQTDGAPETRIDRGGFSASPADLKTVLDAVRKEADGDTLLVCCGKFPAGLSREEAVSFVKELKRIAPRVVLDSASLDASDVAEILPWMIKPNEDEMAALVGHRAESREEWMKEAEALHRKGIAHILLSLGGKGALYCGEWGRCYAEVPKITPLSTVGAGDSTVAGFLAAFRERLGMGECLRRACAFGTAACLEPGTRPPRPETVAEILGEIKIKRG